MDSLKTNFDLKMSVPPQTTNDTFGSQYVRQRFPGNYDEQHQKQINSYFSNQTFGSTLHGQTNLYGGISSGGYRQGMSMRTSSNTNSATQLHRYEPGSGTSRLPLSVRQSPSQADLAPHFGLSQNSPGLVTRLALQNKSYYSAQIGTTGTYNRQSSTMALLSKAAPGHKILSSGNEAIRAEYPRPVLSENRFLQGGLNSALVSKGKTDFGYLNPALSSPSQPSKTYLASLPKFSTTTIRTVEYPSRLVPQKDEADISRMERLTTTKSPVVLSHEEHKVLDKLLEFVTNNKSLDQHTYRLNKERIFEECLPSDRKNVQRLHNTQEKTRSLDEQIKSLAAQVKELQDHFAEVGDYFSPEFALQEISAALNKKQV